MSMLITEIVEETENNVTSPEESIELETPSISAEEETIGNETPSIPAEDESIKSEASNIPAEEESKKAEMVLSNESKDSKPSTSSALMYSEYMNTSEPERVTRIFERKTKKPVILSYGESPLYRKYSELLKKLKESPEEYPTGWGKKFPIVKVHLLMKRKYDSDDSDEDDDDNAENSSIMICKKDDCDSSSDDSSDNEQLVPPKPQLKVEVLEESDSESKDDSKNDSDVNIPSSKPENGSKSCEIIDTCIDSDLTTKTEESEYEHIAKKQRID